MAFVTQALAQKVDDFLEEYEGEDDSVGVVLWQPENEDGEAELSLGDLRALRASVKVHEMQSVSDDVDPVGESR